ncbi:MAG: hypothetical protein J7M10_01185 [Candidatus Cloacimonetes bacterium]|nr:hypothetical protein [Candidatus Cloacimonadota bacterium]
MLNNFNPLLKILFILSQIVFLFFFHNDLLLISVLIILVLSLIIEPVNLLVAITTVMQISPLLLSIFLMGYLFGNPWQKDLMIVGSIAIMMSYTLVLVRSTSAFAFLAQIHKVTPQKIRNSSTLFLYGIIRFLPIIYHEYSHAIKLYNYHIKRKIGLKDISELLPLIVNRSLKKAHVCSVTAERFFHSEFSSSFYIWDILLPVLLLIQIGIILI